MIKVNVKKEKEKKLKSKFCFRDPQSKCIYVLWQVFQQLLLIGKLVAVAIAASLFANWFWHILTRTTSARHSYSYQTCEDLYGSGEPVVQVSTLTFHLLVLGRAPVLSGSTNKTSPIFVKHKNTGNRWHSELQLLNSHSSCLFWQYQLMQGQQTHVILLFRLLFCWVFLLIFEWVMCFFADLQNLWTHLFLTFVLDLLSCAFFLRFLQWIFIGAFVTEVTSMYHVTFIFWAILVSVWVYLCVCFTVEWSSTDMLHTGGFSYFNHLNSFLSFERYSLICKSFALFFLFSFLPVLDFVRILKSWRVVEFESEQCFQIYLLAPALSTHCRWSSHPPFLLWL